MLTNIDDESLDIRRISTDIQRQVKTLLYEEEKIQLSIPADLSLSGGFTASALYITNQRVISFDAQHPNGYLDIPISEVKSADIEQMYGNSIFKVYTDREIVMNRFTNTVDDLFYDAVSFLKPSEQISGVKTAGETGKSEGSKFRCPKCGRALPKKSSICRHCIDTRAVVTRLLSYLRPYKKTAAIGMFCALAATSASLVPPYLTRILIDDVLLANNLQLLWIIVAVLFTVQLIQAIFNGLRTFHMRYLAGGVIFDLRTELYRKMQSLSINYYDKRSTGSIMSRISNDTQQLQMFIMQATQTMLVQIFTLIIIGVFMFTMDWQLAFLTLTPIPLVVFGAKAFSKKVHPIYHRVWRRRAWLNAIIGDAIPGIRVIKAFTGEDREIDRFTEQGEDLFNEQIRVARMASVFGPTVSFLMLTGSLIIWGLGGYWVITQPDRLSLGILVAFIGYMARFYAPIQFLANLSDMLQQATTSAERVFEILDSDPEPNHAQGKMIEKVEGGIEFKNVTFFYEKEKKALQNFNLKINPGETIGLVGSTGSGKTTIANLLLRYYDAEDGEILLDGNNIQDIDIHNYRSHIGFVLQEPLLFRGTLADNIAYSKPDASVEEIIEAGKVANAHDFICNFPDAYDTRVGERGVGLSGGERQRISIARAVIKDPRILVLDEATSAVDTETEKLIQEAIDRLIQNRTTIIIAHRLSTLRKANKIIVLKDGLMDEMGTHDELMKKKGAFYRLIKLQTDFG